MFQSFKRLKHIMVRNSHYLIKEKVLLGIYRLFFEVISQGKNKQDFFQILDEIISPTEKLMLAKRVAIIYLLMKNTEVRKIVDTLKVSTATIAKYVLLFSSKDSRLTQILKTILNNREIRNYLSDIFKELLIQPGIKKGHWKLYRQHENDKNDIF